MTFPYRIPSSKHQTEMETSVSSWSHGKRLNCDRDINLAEFVNEFNTAAHAKEAAISRLSEADFVDSKVVSLIQEMMNERALTRTMEDTLSGIIQKMSDY